MLRKEFLPIRSGLRGWTRPTDAALGDNAMEANDDLPKLPSDNEPLRKLSESQRIEEELDEELDQSFPASDPPSLTRDAPFSRPPDNDRERDPR